MHSVCDRYVLSYNGEIYNHLDLRADLERTGEAPPWRGHSDTETLLAAIAAWGLDAALRRSHGMFALALWDRKNRRLSLARDRMGEKPLYWGWAGKTLVFGSQLKALRHFPGCPRDICPAALAQYFRFAYVPAPYSIHPGLYKLEPGSILEVEERPPEAAPATPLRPGERLGALSIRRYWSLTDMLEQAEPFDDAAEALSLLEATLTRAVSRQLISDVPLGAFLSGGVDSSLIAALMQAEASRPVRTFTIGFEDKAYNEAPYAAAVARHLGTDHTEVMVTDRETRDVIPSLPSLYDEPFADSSQIPTYLVCKAAREHVTVALSGDAGDELFGGYTRYLWGPRLWNRLGPLPSVLRRGLGKAIDAVPDTGWDSVGAFAGRVRPGLAVSRPREKARKLARQLRRADSLDGLYRGLVSVWDDPPVHPAPEIFSLLDDPLPHACASDAAGRMMAQDMRTYLPDDILCKVDRAAMSVSLETRVPFLDPDVLALSARLTDGMKMRGGVGKWPLRQILYRHVPPALIERPKTGFGIPVGDWLRGPLREWGADMVSGLALRDIDYLQTGIIGDVWSDHVAEKGNHTDPLWAALMFAEWSQSYQDDYA